MSALEEAAIQAECASLRKETDELRKEIEAAYHYAAIDFPGQEGNTITDLLTCLVSRVTGDWADKNAALREELAAEKLRSGRMQKRISELEVDLMDPFDSLQDRNRIIQELSK